jgi:predicted DsbA family dithiol-disulfide isomerase
METQLKTPSTTRSGLELDLIADFTCPWSYLGKRRLEHALENLYGAPVLALRWHGFRVVNKVASLSWKDYLATRLPQGSDLELAEQSLRDAGKAIGIRFRFDQIGQVPDTLEAHRLIKLAAGDVHANHLADALFEAFFEQGRDIGDLKVLNDIGVAAGLAPSVAAAFSDAQQGRGAVAGEEQRLRSLGVAAVPNLLINGHILVPGPAEVSTYVQALDQALFPQLAAPADRHALH